MRHHRPGVSVSMRLNWDLLGEGGIESYVAMALWLCTGEALCQDQIEPAPGLSGKVAAGLQRRPSIQPSADPDGLLSLRLSMQPSENHGPVEKPSAVLAREPDGLECMLMRKTKESYLVLDRQEELLIMLAL